MKTSNPKTAFPVLLLAFVGILLFGGRFAVIGQLLNNGLAIFQESSEADGYIKTIEGPLSQQNKIHWPQMPDFGQTGLDVEMTQYPLADDFKCLATGPISDIHFWASFANDVLPPAGPNSLTLELSIYSDVPVDAIKWSRPGEKLWSRTFNPREYSVSKIDNRPLGWYNPWTQNYIPTNHRLACQYDFYIKDNPFIQQEGTIYWLAIEEVNRPANAVYKVGWKTTSKKLGWNDAAVYYYSLPGGYFVWLPMAYPARHEYAEQRLHLAFAITDVNDCHWKHDLGDAPDSSNSFPGLSMLAYPPDVNGNFPTVYQVGSPPYGPIHLQPKTQYYLGKDVTFESEADLGPDQDPDNNLEPTLNLPDRDGAEDGLHLPVYMPNCAATTLEVDATIINPLTINNPAFLNVWCDWNRDGDWDDTIICQDGNSVPEWAVQNYAVTSIATGLVTLTTPAFLCWHSQATNLPGPMWVRVSLADQPWQSIPGAAMFGGDGPAAGYQYGETEDYFVYPKLNQEKPADWGDAPDDAAVPGYPTLSSHNGARHVIAGPWLGDANDAPDSETNGLPDANALGDDKNNRDDEGGVTIPPLIPGYPADVVLEVGGGAGVVQAWFDFDANAVWSSSEQVFNGFLPTGMHTISFVVPANAVPGQSFARFRISKAGGLGTAGLAPNGEVEDYEISIKPPLKDTKWIQLPDVTPDGVDIRIDSNDGIFRTIADDFNCTSTDLLTDVHLWGSWKKDIIGAITKIHLSIHPDDPAGQAGADPDNKYSKPGPEILWQDSFLPGQFLQSLYHVVRKPGQWWWDPVKNEVVQGANRKLWRIDIYIDPNKAFKQEGTLEKPIIYWLDVSIDTKDGQFGWKSRRWPEHFMDDAVQDINDLPREWDELRFPKTNLFHDIEQNSVDMAFQLTYSQEPNLPTMRPVSATQCPVVETQCPTVATKCPPVNTQCPAVQTQCVAITMCPPVNTTCPALNTVCPAEQTRCPATTTQCPATLSVCPPVPTQCTAVETQCPPAETKCPAVSTECPAVNTQCPVSDTKCPATPTRCKVIETECPAIDTQCPPSDTKCPPTLSVCPPVPTQCTAVDTQCPTVDTQCPTASTRCPVVSTQCPVTVSSCPPAQTTQCPVETQCPAVQTQCPPAQTKCPPTQTECQTVTTECPAVETRCPPQLSVCPPVETQCTPVDTQCPAVETKCPVVTTGCPIPATQCPSPTGACLQSVGGGRDIISKLNYSIVLESCPALEVRSPTVLVRVVGILPTP